MSISVALNFMLDILNDSVMFWILEGVILITLLFSIWQDAKSTGFAKVKRGKESLSDLRIGYGIASVALVALTSSIGFLAKYRVITMIINLSVCIYLFFFNGWFRNQIIGYFMKAREKWEKLV